QNDTYASITNVSKKKNSQFLHAQNFGFAIDPTATIDGIVVEIDRYSTNPVTDAVVDLIDASGSVVGSSPYSGAAWPTSDGDSYQTYGGAAILWGTTWTAADINNANFGVALQARIGDGANASIYVDHIRVTVYYTSTSTLNTITKGSATMVSASCNWVTISPDIIVDEGAANNFAGGQANQTYVLSAPAGFEFNPGIGSVSEPGGGDISAISLTVTSGTATVTMSTSGTANTDQFTISGLQLMATTATAGSYTLGYDAGTSTGTWGANDGENHADLIVNSSPTITGGDGTFIEGDATPVTLSNIVINEVVNDNFEAGQTTKTYTILPPSSVFTFNAGIGSASVTSGTTDITALSMSVVSGSITLTITTDATADQIDEITITGIQMILGTITPGVYTYNNEYSCSSSTGNWGLSDGTSHGTLSVSGPILSVASGDWGNPATWDCNCVPTATDMVAIQAGDIVYVNNHYTCASLTINGELNYDTQNRDITVTGDCYVNSTVDITAVNGSDLAVGGDCYFDNGHIYFKPGGNGGSLNVTGNLSVSGTSTLAQAAANNNQDIIVGGTLTIETGADASIGGSNFTIAGQTSIDGTITYTASSAGTKEFGDDISISVSGVWDNTVGEDPHVNGNITNNGSWIGCTGGECTLFMGYPTAGVYTISGNSVQTSILDINAGTSVTNTGEIHVDGAGTSGAVLTGAGTYINEGILEIGGLNTCIDVNTFNVSTAGNIVNYNAANDQEIRIPSDGSYSNLVCSTLGVKFSSGNTQVDSRITIKESAILDIDTDTYNGTADLYMQDNSEFRIAKLATVPEFTGSYNYVGGTLTFDGAGAQTYNAVPSGATTCFNIKLDNSGAKTLDGMMTVNGDIIVTGASSIASHSSFTQASAKTFIFSTSATTTLTAATPITIGTMNMESGTLIDNGITINVTGSSWNKDGGIFTATGTVNFPTSTIVTGTSTTTFNNVSISGTGNLTGHATNMEVIGTWDNDGTFNHNNGEVSFLGSSFIDGSTVTNFYDIEIAGGTVTQSAFNTNIENNWLHSAGTFVPNGKMVTFIGGNTQTIQYTGGTENFYSLRVQKTDGTKVEAAATTTISASNMVQIISGILDMNAETLTGTGGLMMSGGELQLAKLATAVPELAGPFALISGTVTLDGAGDQILKTTTPNGSIYYNINLENSGAKDISGMLTLNGDITIAGSASLSAHSSFTQASAKTFYYTSTGTTNLAGNITIGNFVQNAAGGTFSPNGNTITVKGNTWTYTAGSFTASGKVLFQGSAQQTLSGTITFDELQIDNSNHLVISSDVTVNTLLTFTSGNIVTNTQKVIMPISGSIARASGHVEGNLQKAFDLANTSASFEVGTGSSYSPVDIVFTGLSGAGDIICAADTFDHPDIYASDIDPNKTVNRYWTITNNGVSFTSYNTVFNFLSSDVDLAADESNFEVRRYDGVEFLNTTINLQNNNFTSISGETGFGDFICGEKFNPDYLTNAVSGTMTWNDQTHWIKYRTGVISSDGSTTITGNGTYFVSGPPENPGVPEMAVDDVLLLQNDPDFIVGTVTAIIDDETLTIDVNNKGSFSNASFGVHAIPSTNSYVVLGNPYVGAAVTVDMDVETDIYKLLFKDEPYSITLNNNTFKLSISNNATVKQPSLNNEDNLWNIGTGWGNISGNIKLGSDDSNLTRVAKVTTSSGKLYVYTNIVFDCNSVTGGEQTGIIEATSSALIIAFNQVILNNGKGTISPGSSSRFNYLRSASGQNVILESEIKYAHLWLRNQHTDGAILTNDITTTNVTGYIWLFQGNFNTDGYAITGNPTRFFRHQDGTNFYVTKGSVYPTGFGSYNIGTASNTYYNQNVNSNIKSGITYGNLYLQPQANSTSLTFDAGTTTVAGELHIGDGTYTDITVDANTNDATVDVNSNATLYTNTTFEADNVNTMRLGGNWTDNGGTFNHNNGEISFDGATDQLFSTAAASYTLYDIDVNKTGGTLSFGTTSELTVNDMTMTQGNFTAPTTLNINGNSTLNGGTFTGGTTIVLKGNWTDNGGTFEGASSALIFNNTTAGQLINGTATDQSFADISIENTGQTLSTGGSTTTLTFGSLSLAATAGTFTAPATTNITGSLNILGGTYNLGTNTNISTDISYNGGLLVPGTGTITLNGTSDQVLGGTQSYPALSNLTINNTSNTGTEITSNSAVTVNGTLTLTDGNLVTSDVNILSMGTASSIAGGSDNSFVKGPMKHTIATTAPTNKVFPVGTDSLHKAELNIKQVAATSTDYTCKYITSSAVDLGWTLPGTIDKVSNIGYWDISKGAGASIASASATLHYNFTDGVEDEANLRIAKGNPTAWSDIGGVGTTSPTGSIGSTVNFTSFSYFTLANKTGGANPLPVELLSFNAEYVAGDVELKWQTASEINNDHFEIERTSDGVNFETVLTVQGMGNTNSLNDYFALDENPMEG
ncbi:MAG: hypothetical protein C0594_10565, partial [Marinilabiliales bacterium]